MQQDDTNPISESRPVSAEEIHVASPVIGASSAIGESHAVPMASVCDDPVLLKNLRRRDAIIDVLFIVFMFFVPSLLQEMIADFAGLPARTEGLGSLIYFVAVAQAIVAMVLVAFVLYKDRLGWVSLGLRRLTIGRVAVDVAMAGVALAVIYAGIMIFGIIALGGMSEDQQRELVQQRTETLKLFAPLPVGWAMAFCLMVGVYEEILFRGFILPRLRRVFGGWLWAVIVSSLFFGVVHLYQGWMAVGQIVVVAAVLSLVFIVTRSLLSAILAHAAFDFVSLAVMPRVMQWMENDPQLKDMLQRLS